MNHPIAALDCLFHPQSVAIFGASDDAARISGRPVDYMLRAQYKGRIYPINPGRKTVQGLASYAALRDLPEVPDVVVIALAATAVEDALLQCVDARVRAVIIFSSGFSEEGAAGQERQRKLLELARRAHIRVVGPNCVGLFNADTGFYGTFSQTVDRGVPTPSHMAMVCQSGAYGGDMLFMARQRKLGFKYWASTGNEGDVELAECLLWMVRQPEIKVVVCHIEGVRNGPLFLQALAEAQLLRKPIVMLKVGRSAAGARAAASHTDALVGADAVYDAVFAQFGVYRARTPDEQLDVAAACAMGAYPGGRRLGVLTISGGIGAQICDSAERYQLEVPALGAQAREKLSQLVPFGVVDNPCDTTAQPLNDMDLMHQFLSTFSAERFDAVVAFFSSVPASERLGEKLRNAIHEGLVRREDRFVALCMIVDDITLQRYRDDGFAAYSNTDRAVQVVGALASIQEGFERGHARAHAPRPGRPVAIDRRECQERQAGTLSEFESKQWLAEAGIRVSPQHLVQSAEDAVSAAAQTGYPVALKIVSPDILHKTDIGGVCLNVADEEAVRRAFSAVMQNGRAVPHARIDGVVVSPMVAEGVEMFLGIKRDAVFGLLVVLAVGGIFVEVLGDSAARLVPVDREEARRMVDELKGCALLRGSRGRPRADEDALLDAIVRLSEFAEAHADIIDSVDVNPLVVLENGQGAVALDASIVLNTSSSTETANA